MTKRCEGHGVWMEERHSKTKVEEDGSPKAYFGHSISPGKMCFGIKDEGASVDPEKEMDTFTKDLDAEKKHEALNQLEGVAKKETETVIDKPMTSADWNIKGYEKSWGVFSAPARKVEASPKDAIMTMHLWEWMDSVHGDEPGYKEWKEGVNRRVGKQE